MSRDWVDPREAELIAKAAKEVEDARIAKAERLAEAVAAGKRARAEIKKRGE